MDLKQNEGKGRISGEEEGNSLLEINPKFKVKYEVRKMSLGQGVFVLEPVKQGSLIWRCKDTIDQLTFFMHNAGS